MKECTEIGTVGEVLSLATCHVNHLNNLIEVQGLKGTANILDIIGCEQVVTMLAIQTQEAHVMAHRSMSVQLFVVIINILSTYNIFS